MEAEAIRRLGPMLEDFLAEFDDCFGRRDTRAHLPVYVGGQLSNLERKSVEPIALAADVPVRTLQEFLTHLTWDHGRMRDHVARIVVRDHADPESIGLIDETSVVKKGRMTPGVQRQYLGCVGKPENGIVSVHLGYAAGDFHTLLDGDLFLPKSWHEDRERCRAAGIPDEVVYRPKSEIALELYDRAVANGVHFAWLTFDEWYGSKPAFLDGLDQRGQAFVAEVPRSVVAWVDPPKVTHRPDRKGRRGRPRRTPRLVAGSRSPLALEQLADTHPALCDQAWQLYHVKDGEKGPIVWEARHAMVFPKDERGLPKGPWHLVVARQPLTGEVKYFLSNAPPGTPVATLLRVAFTRWRIERCFQDGKGEVGLDHWEGRRWIGLQRHLALTAVSHLFLARTRLRLRGGKSGAHDAATPRGGRCAAPIA